MQKGLILPIQHIVKLKPDCMKTLLSLICTLLLTGGLIAQANLNRKITLPVLPENTPSEWRARLEAVVELVNEIDETPDSSHCYLFNPETGTWTAFITERQLFTYDNEDRPLLIRYFERDPEDPDFITEGRFTFTYRSDGQLLTSKAEIIDEESGLNFPLLTVDNTYNEQGQLVQSDQYFLAFFLEIYSRETYTYDEKGRNIEVIQYARPVNLSTGEIGEDYELQKRTTNTFNGQDQLIESIEELWDIAESSWVNDLRTLSTYTPQGAIALETIQLWDVVNMVWLNDNRTDYSAEPDSLLKYLWSEESMSWWINQKYMLVQISDEETAFLKFERSSPDETFIITDRTESVYDAAKGRVTKVYSALDETSGEMVRADSCIYFFGPQDVSSVSQFLDRILPCRMANPNTPGGWVNCQEALTGTNAPGYFELYDLNGRRLQRVDLRLSAGFELPAGLKGGLYLALLRDRNGLPLERQKIIIAGQ